MLRSLTSAKVRTKLQYDRNSLPVQELLLFSSNCRNLMRAFICFADNPEFEFCIVTAKYLIECATTKPLLAEVIS